MFKVGDRIMCVDDSGVDYSLTNNKVYVVKAINTFTNDTVVVDSNRVYDDWFCSSRFVIDIKDVRKQKLKKICSK